MVFYFLANFLIQEKKKQEYFPIGTTIGMVSIFEHSSWSCYKVF
jgi:hypothetical protein